MNYQLPNSSRSVVLRRIRTALAAAPPAAVAVPRDYDRQLLAEPGNATRFAEVVAEYRAQVLRIDHASIASTVAGLLAPNAILVTPADAPDNWTRGLAIRSDRTDRPLTVSELDGANAVLTGCALAIAATGTIVLDAGTAQGRRVLSLVPDHHICVVYTDQIVDTVPQAFDVLDPLRPLTFISGPSATSDIELSRVEGVHGPRTLDVLLVAR